MSRNKRTPLISLSISSCPGSRIIDFGLHWSRRAPAIPRNEHEHDGNFHLEDSLLARRSLPGSRQSSRWPRPALATLAVPVEEERNGTQRAIASSYMLPATTSADNGAQFIVTVSDSTGNMTRNVATLTVNGSLTSQLTVPTTSLIQAFTNQSYSATMSVTGTPGYTWSIVSGSLPSGMSLMPSTGQISGTQQ